MTAFVTADFSYKFLTSELKKKAETELSVLPSLNSYITVSHKKTSTYCTRLLVDATGFEPATSASRTQRSTKLSHASLIDYLKSCLIIIAHLPCFVQIFFNLLFMILYNSKAKLCCFRLYTWI